MPSETDVVVKAEKTMRGDDEDAVKVAAACLIDAFARHDRDAYFACFSADATFVFYNQPLRLENREEYERAWQRWEAADGFRVLNCNSSAQLVQCFGDVAVFTHSVRTEITTNKGREALHERETIVFRRLPGGGWIAVHEHLSPAS